MFRHHIHDSRPQAGDFHLQAHQFVDITEHFHVRLERGQQRPLESCASGRQQIARSGLFMPIDIRLARFIPGRHHHDHNLLRSRVNGRAKRRIRHRAAVPI